MKSNKKNEEIITNHIKIKVNKLTKVVLIHHTIIDKIMKYDKEFRPKDYNENIKKAIKYLLKEEKRTINDML